MRHLAKILAVLFREPWNEWIMALFALSAAGMFVWPTVVCCPTLCTLCAIGLLLRTTYVVVVGAPHRRGDAARDRIRRFVLDGAYALFFGTLFVLAIIKLFR